MTGLSSLVQNADVHHHVIGADVADDALQIRISKGRIALRPYQPSARRVYQPATLP
jgi:hypothetical protein